MFMVTRSAGVVAAVAGVVAGGVVVLGAAVCVEQPRSNAATATEPKRARASRFMGV
ncbi:MAG: DUF2613 family protein [Cellulomonas sp.]|nr:DUF2613 family protein [Cellulomonas sp.]